MKNSIGTLIAFCILCLFTTMNLYAQGPCLKLLRDADSTFSNPDSIMVDSCSSSPTYLHKFAKESFAFWLQYGSMLPIPAAPVDSIIDVEWTQIDTAYSSTRAGFDTLQQKFGHFILHKDVSYAGDTTDISSRFFSLRFDSFVDIQTAVNQMLLIPFLAATTVSYLDRSGIANGVNKSYIRKDEYLIRPNPAISEISISGGNLQNINYEIFSAVGVQVKEDVLTIDHPVISTLSLAPAIYFLRINGAWAGSFVVIH